MRTDFRVFKQSDLDFVASSYKFTTDAELAKSLDKSERQIESFRLRNNLPRGRKPHIAEFTRKEKEQMWLEKQRRKNDLIEQIDKQIMFNLNEVYKSNEALTIMQHVNKIVNQFKEIQ